MNGSISFRGSPIDHIGNTQSMTEKSLHIELLTVELFIPMSNSLKTKRMSLRSIKDRVKHHYNVSIAELDFHDKWQRACLGFCMISMDAKIADKTFSQILKMIGSVAEVEITQHNVEHL